MYKARSLMVPIALAAVCAPLSACAHGGRVALAASAADWRSVATDADRDRIRNWRQSWTEALAKARATGHGDAIDREGVLLQPDAALADSAPPAGDYRCRTIKLGGKTPANPDFARYGDFPCRIAVEKDLLSFAQIGGPQRPAGLLFADDKSQMIFLGTMRLGDETHAMDYGDDPERDMAGLFERIGAKRWRLILPRPHWESMLDVIELVP